MIFRTDQPKIKIPVFKIQEIVEFSESKQCVFYKYLQLEGQLYMPSSITFYQPALFVLIINIVSIILLLIPGF